MKLKVGQFRLRSVITRNFLLKERLEMKMMLEVSWQSQLMPFSKNLTVKDATL